MLFVGVGYLVVYAVFVADVDVFLDADVDGGSGGGGSRFLQTTLQPLGSSHSSALQCVRS